MKGKFHAKMGLIKDRNGMDLTEAEDSLHDPDSHDGVITHSPRDIHPGV